MFRFAFTGLVIAGSLAVAGCNDSSSCAQPGQTDSPNLQPVTSPIPPAAFAVQAPPGVVKPEDLLEGPHSRDPFRSFLQSVLPPIRTDPVVLDEYSPDQLKLIGIVHAGNDARVMVVDPHGRGWVLVRGQRFGRADTVRVASTEYEVHWKIDRVRERDVVLIRDNPAVEGAHTTRLLAM